MIVFTPIVGIVLGAFILKGAMLHTPGFKTPRLDYSTGKVLIVRERWGLTILWVASHFSIQVFPKWSFHFPTSHLSCSVTVYHGICGETSEIPRHLN
jgi:hypothetical protein